MTSRKIGIYGGTFDPIHFGHLSLAFSLFEQKGLDEVWFCPAYCSPHKRSGEGTSPEHRFEMVSRAVEGIPAFKVIDLEIKRQGASFTVDTLREVGRMEPDAQLFLLLGSDSARFFSTWRSPEKILAMATPLVGLRSAEDQLKIEYDNGEDHFHLLSEGLVKIPIIEISATEIRQRVAKKLFIGHLVPEKVLEYIAAHSLYF